MTSKLLIESLVKAVQESPLHKDTKIYLHETNTNGFWRVVFIDTPDRIARIEKFNKGLESLWGGSETSHISKYYGKSFNTECVCLEVS